MNLNNDIYQLLKKHMTNENKTILIVEDEQDLREALADKLTREAFTVLTAKNGKVGLDSALLKHPDLILLDIVMPEMDGMTVLKKLREDVWGKTVPVILLTNLSATEENIIEEMVKYAPSHYLVKSDWKISDVVEKIRETLK